MKKWFVYIIVVIILAGIATIIGIDHEKAKNLKKAEDFMTELARNTFSGYAGIINASQINMETGHIYNGPLIHRKVVEQAGLEETADTRSTFLMTVHGVDVYLMTVYRAGQDSVPLLQRDIKQYIIYGLI